LSTIQRLSNQDKHRLPLLSLFGPGRVRIDDIEIHNAVYIGHITHPETPYRVGEVVCSVRFIPEGPNPSIEFDAFPQPRVTFDDATPTLDTLESAAHFVVGVLAEFGDPPDADSLPEWTTQSDDDEEDVPSADGAG
jgi:hypothetical protein